MSAAPGRFKQARTAARPSEVILMRTAGPLPGANPAIRSMKGA